MATLDIRKGTSTNIEELSYQVFVTDEGLPVEKSYSFALVFDVGTPQDERLQKIQSEAKRYIKKWKDYLAQKENNDDPLISTQTV